MSKAEMIRETARVWDCAHQSLLAGDWSTARQAIETLMQRPAGCVADRLNDLAQYEQVAGRVPGEMRPVIESRLGLLNARLARHTWR